MFKQMIFMSLVLFIAPFAIAVSGPLELGENQCKSKVNVATIVALHGSLPPAERMNVHTFKMGEIDRRYPEQTITSDEIYFVEGIINENKHNVIIGFSPQNDCQLTFATVDGKKPLFGEENCRLYVSSMMLEHLLRALDKEDPHLLDQASPQTVIQEVGGAASKTDGDIKEYRAVSRVEVGDGETRYFGFHVCIDESQTCDVARGKYGEFERASGVAVLPEQAVIEILEEYDAWKRENSVRQGEED